MPAMNKGLYRLSLQWTGMASAGVALLALAKMALLTRWLESADFGLMALVTFALGLMDLFADMGLNTALIHKPSPSRSLFSGVYLLGLTLGLLLWALSFPLGKGMALFYQMEDLALYIPLAALGLVLSALGAPCKVLEQKDLQFRGISLVTLVAALASFGLSVGLAYKGYGVLSLIWGLLLLQSLKSLGFLALRLRKGPVFAAPDFRAALPLAQVGFWHFAGQLINTLHKDLDILLMGKFFSAELLGGYSLAKELAKRPLQILLPSLHSIMGPALAAKHPASAMALDYVRMLKALSSVLLPAYLLLALSAPVLVPWLYGEAYRGVVGVFALFCGTMALRGAVGTVGHLVAATGKTRLEFSWNAATVLLTPLLVVLGLQAGTLGVALALLLNGLLLFYPGWYFMIRPLIPLSWKEYRAAFLEWRQGWQLIYSMMRAPG
jgi:O-antigen/teichoic acid export membrane protein